MEHTEFGLGYTISYGDQISAQRDPISAQMREAQERMYAEMLNPKLRIRRQWTYRDRLKLAWRVILGQITWDDIN